MKVHGARANERAIGARNAVPNLSRRACAVACAVSFYGKLLRKIGANGGNAVIP
jgi:hypothetical protein